MDDHRAQRAAFRKLHESGCFVIPNPWDGGTTRFLRSLGFKAVATTSAGFGFARGLPDDARALTRDMVLTHISESVAAAEDIPVNADYQNGYAPTADGVGQSVRMCIGTGVAGLSIEDGTGDPERPLFELSEALDRVRAARAAIVASGADVMLTARAECFLAGSPDPLRESIKRLTAYSEAGADVLFAPGVREMADIRAIVSAVAPKPVNVLISANTGLRVADLAELGVRRVSVGSALARVAWGAFMKAARRIARDGTFVDFDDAVPFAELNQLFRKRR